MTNKKMAWTTALATGAAFLTGPGLAQDTELEQLRQRVEVLEAEQATIRNPDSPKLELGLGGSTTIEVYGFARFEAFYDFDFNQGDLSTAQAVGDPANATDGEFNTNVRVSRLGIRSATDTDIGTVGTQLEFDLFGSGGDESGSPNLRLRHANVTIDDNWLFGQFWTNFMPLSHYPRTADFNGPVGITFARVPQVRYSNQTTSGVNYSFSVEESNGASSDDPVFTAAVVYGTDTWSARIAGVTGRVNDGAGDDLTYNGVTLSGSVVPWDGGVFTGTYVTGDALGSLLIGGGDDVVAGQTNDVDGFTIEFRQQVGEKWNFGIAYGSEDYDGTTAATNFLGAKSIHLNAFYTPVENLTFAAEYIMIEREDATGATFDGDRVGVSVTYAF